MNTRLILEAGSAEACVSVDGRLDVIGAFPQLFESPGDLVPSVLEGIMDPP